MARIAWCDSYSSLSASFDNRLLFSASTSCSICWATASEVRRCITCLADSTMKQLEKQCMCVKFFFKLGKSFVQTFELLKQAYGAECISRMQCYEWFKRFKEGRISVNKDPMPGGPSTSTDDCHVERVHEAIRGNRRLTVREVAEEMGISVRSCHAILTGKFLMHRVSAKFVPHLLTDW